MTETARESSARANVLVEALRTLLVEFNVMGRQDISDYIKNTLEAYEAKLSKE